MTRPTMENGDTHPWRERNSNSRSQTQWPSLPFSLSSMMSWSVLTRQG